MQTLTTKSIIAGTGLANTSVSTKLARLAIRRDGVRVVYDAVDVIPLMASPRLRRAVPDLLASAIQEGDDLYCGPAAEAVRRGKLLHQWMEPEPEMRDRQAALRVRFAEGLGRGAPSGSLRDYLPQLEFQLLCHPSIYRAAILGDRSGLPEDWADFSMAFAAVNISHIYQ